MAAKKQKPRSVATGQGSKSARSRQSKAANKKTTRKATSSQLMRRDTARSGLTATDCKKLGFKPLTPTENEKLTGFFVPGYLIPYTDINKKKVKDAWRVRHLEEIPGKMGSVRKKPVRYTGPKGQLPRLYFPANFGNWAGLAKDASELIYLTEGEKKAAALCKAGLPCVAVPGVWGWKSKKHGVRVIKDFSAIKWNYENDDGETVPRPLAMVFDNDVIIKPEVLAALNALSYELTNFGAAVFIVHLPEGKLKGVDDFLVAKGVAKFQALRITAFKGSESLWQFQETVAYVKANNYFVDVEDLRTFPDMSKLRQAFGNLSYEVPKADGDGTKTVYVVDEWLKWELRRTFERLTFAPGEGLTVGNALNTWRGWGCDPNAGTVKPFLDLVKYIFANEPAVIDWFMQWLAYPLQNPGTKLLTGVLVWSQSQGVGKTFIGEIMRSIYGDNASRIEKEDIVGDWNGWLINKQFILGEEITGGDSRHVADKVKNMITRTTAQSKIKYQAAFEIEDRANYFLTSNHEDSLHLKPGERRFLVVHCDRDKKPDDFYERIDKWHHNGGASHLFHYLLNEVDCSTFKPNAAAPETAAKRAMISLSKTDVDLLADRIRDDPDGVLLLGKSKLTQDLFTGVAVRRLASEYCDRHVAVTAMSKALARVHIEARKVKSNGRTVLLWPLRNHARWNRRSSKEWSDHFEKTDPTKFRISR